VLDAYDLYQKGLKNHRACDFDDLLSGPSASSGISVMQGVYGERFRYILVDEYQDTNRAQYLLVQHLARRHHNLCVVGDEISRSMVGEERTSATILDFQQDFPEAVRIELLQNYRSTKKILDAASEVISNNAQRVEGKGALITDLGDGESIIFKLSDEGRLEAEWVVQRIQELRFVDPEARFAVLYRANWQSRQMEEALRAQNMAYRLVGGVKFYERQEVKDLISYLRLIRIPSTW